MFNKRKITTIALTATAVNANANGIFSVFDADKNGSIEPTEVYSAFEQMDVKSDNKVTRKEFMKVMDGHVREFCGV
jgi:Ca2+-binding EF-hand superfamily protein